MMRLRFSLLHIIDGILFVILLTNYGATILNVRTTTASDPSLYSKLALERLINDTISSHGIREKLHLFFDNLGRLAKPNSSFSAEKHFLTNLIKLSPDTVSRKARGSPSCEEIEFANNDVINLMKQELRAVKKMYNIRLTDKKEQLCVTKCSLECKKQECPTPNCPIIPSDAKICSSPQRCPRGCTAHWIESPSVDLAKNGLKRKKSSRIKKNRSSQFRNKTRSASRGFVRFSMILNREQKIHFNESFEQIELYKLKEEALARMLEILDYLKEDITHFSDGILYNYPMIAKLYHSQQTRSVIIRESIMSILGNLIPDFLTNDFVEKESKKRPQDRSKGDKDLNLKIDQQLLQSCEKEEKLLFSYCDGKSCADFCPSYLNLERCNFKCSNNEHCGQYQCYCRKIKQVLGI